MRNHHRSRLIALGAASVFALSSAALPALAEPAVQQPAPEQSTSSMPQSFAPLINRVKPAVVNISTTELESSADRSQLPQFPPGSPFDEFFHQFGMQAPQGALPPSHPLTALGSGFIIDPSGIIVTNNHVIKNGTNIEATLQDGTTLKAKVIGHDDLTDLAVLKVSADHPLPYVKFGDSDGLQVGDWVVSVGNPFGLGGTVTAGILSARGRNIHEGPYDDFLQVDAPINQGNSGGPTFDRNGNVVGINTAIFSPNGGGSVGIGFAIPSNLARPVVAELEKSGTVVRGWLGVAVQGIRPDMEDALGVKSTNGALIATVSPDGPAAQAGLKPGDVITEYDSHPIRRLRDLTWAVANTAPGKTVTLTYLRNGDTHADSVTVGRMRPQQTAEATSETEGQPQVGLEMQAVTPETRQQYDLPRNIQGVLVLDVAQGGPADRAGIQAGDVIEKVGRTVVRSPRQVYDQIRSARDEGKKSIAMDIERNGQEQFVVVPLPKSNQS